MSRSTARTAARTAARPQPVSPAATVAKLAVLASVFSWAGVVLALLWH